MISVRVTVSCGQYVMQKKLSDIEEATELRARIEIECERVIDQVARSERLIQESREIIVKFDKLLQR